MQNTATLASRRQIAAIRTAAYVLRGTAQDMPATAGLRLAELLDEIAKAWQSSTEQPISTGEQLRWTPVCVKAARIAEELTR